MLYLYCWVVGQTIRNLPSDPNRRRSAPVSHIHVLSDPDDSTDTSDDNTAPADMNEHFGDVIHIEQFSSPIRNPEIPLAHMLPTGIQRNPVVIVSDNEDSDSHCLRVPPSHASRTNKHEAVHSTPQPEPSPNKRQKGCSEDSADDTDPPSPFLTRKRLVGTGISSMQTTTSYPSPPTVQQETPSHVASNHDFPNGGRNGDTSSTKEALCDARDAGEKVTGALASTKESQQGDFVQDADVESANNPGKVDEEVPRIEVGTSQNVPSSTEPLRSVIPVKPMDHLQLRDTEDIRRLLFSNLWDALPAGLQRSNAPLLSSTVQILESLSERDTTTSERSMWMNSTATMPRSTNG
jgi:hypothetical protein